MKWTSDYSLEKLFISKEVRLMNEDKQEVIIRVPTIAEHFSHPEINIFNNILGFKKDAIVEIFKHPPFDTEIHSNLELCYNLLINGKYKELLSISDAIRKTLNFLFNTNIKFKEGSITINNSLTLDEDLFEYVIYVLRKSEGMKIEPPRTFKSEADRQRYLEQLAREEKIRKIRATGTNLIQNGKQNGKNSIITGLSVITQAYPQYKFEDMLTTMCFEQIAFLQESAVKILNYQVERSAYAAGNLKKLKGFWE